MVWRPVCWMLLAAVLALTATVQAKDKEKAECKENCSVTIQSCKQDCQVERDSGDQQESYLYRQCDESCRDDYEACTDQCEQQ